MSERIRACRSLLALLITYGMPNSFRFSVVKMLTSMLLLIATTAASKSRTPISVIASRSAPLAWTAWVTYGQQFLDQPAVWCRSARTS